MKCFNHLMIILINSRVSCASQIIIAQLVNTSKIIIILKSCLITLPYVTFILSFVNIVLYLMYHSHGLRQKYFTKQYLSKQSNMHEHKLIL